MRVVVCVKHVPDVQSDRRLESGRLVRGEDDVLNELDENAIEAAVSLVEEHGGEVVALSMGPEDATATLRRALQMGACRAVLVTDERAAGSDVVGTAQVLARAINKIAEQGDSPIDLVLTGMSSLDGMNSMLPAALATMLNIPALTLASELQYEGNSVQITKQADDYVDVLRVQLPAVLSVTDQVNTPRYPNFKAMAAARSKPLDTWDLDDLGVVGVSDSRVGSAGAGTRVFEAAPLPARTGGTIITDTGDAGVRLAEFIKQTLAGEAK